MKIKLSRFVAALLLAGLAMTQAGAEDLYDYRTPREAQW